VDGVVVDVDEDILKALQNHVIICHPSTVGSVEGLGLKCSEVTTAFSNVPFHMVLTGNKLFIPKRILH
jgi:hypothetical protein